MDKHPLLSASNRVALAAYLHDLGKFAERAGIAEAEQKNAEGVLEKDIAKQQYCPNFKGRYSHIHAAYTSIAMDILEAHLPDIKKQDCYPFASWKAGNMGERVDSLINAAAMHHKPDTFLQWVVATADRLASGFERSQFDEYNQAEEINSQQRSHITARMEVLLEKINLNGKANKAEHRYPLAALSPNALIPVAQAQAEPNSNEQGRKEYAALWQEFLTALKRDSGSDAIPSSHKQNLDLWLDHFDTLWLTYTHCIPSATAAKKPEGGFIQIPSDVSLYDHSKTTAALAVALWRWHEAEQKTDDAAATAMRLGEDYQTEKFLLVQGDMFGIQDFIFQTGGSTNKFSSKLLRGRSFYVSLMAECAALRVLDALGLPSTSQIINAAGKFSIVAPNTAEVKELLTNLRADFDRWSIEKTQGRVGIGLAWTAAAAQDFITQEGNALGFKALQDQLFAELDTQKYQRLQLWNAQCPSVLSDYLEAFSEGKVCEVDGVSPAITTKHGIALGQLALDQIAIGNALANYQRILITRNKLEKREKSEPLTGDILGFHVCFASQDEISGYFSKEVSSHNLLRCWDFSLPIENGKASLWKGYARRYINGYVARFSNEDLYREGNKYKQFEAELELEGDIRQAIKSFSHLACEDRYPIDEKGQIITDPTLAKSWLGTPALHAMKGDVDNLGAIFQKGHKRPSFAKTAALSRQINAFFAVYLPWLCQSEFKQSYTVFAGGDDFFLLGSWRSQMHLANRMQQEFKRYVAHNPDIHFSTGFYLTKPGLPISQLAAGAEQALENAKDYKNAQTGQSKNAVSCFGAIVNWDDFTTLVKKTDELNALQQQYNLSTAYIYGLLQLADMADAKHKNNPQMAIWRSQLSYRTYRWVTDKFKLHEGESREDFEQRVKAEASKLTGYFVEHLARYGSHYRLPLSTYLYSYRD